MSRTTILPLSDQKAATTAGYTLHDYLQIDIRPTFLIALSSLSDCGEGVNIPLAFCNTSLSGNTALLNQLTRVLSGHATTGREEQIHDATAQFLAWISAGDRTSVSFCDILWSSTDLNSWRIISGVYLPQATSSSNPTIDHSLDKQSIARQYPDKSHDAQGWPASSAIGHCGFPRTEFEDETPQHSEILLPRIADPSPYQQEIQSFDWSSTDLGPIATWPQALLHAVRLALASPMAVFIYWGPLRNVIWNDASTSMLRGFDGVSPGVSAFEAFRPFWKDTYELLCREVERTGKALTPSKSPGPMIERDGGLRESCWTYNYIPLLNENGSVCGIYGLIHDSTTEVHTEGRVDTLLKVNEAMGMATDLSSFWQVVIAELADNAADVPLAAIYSIGSDALITHYSVPETWQVWHTSSNVNFQDSMHHKTEWVLEGQIGFPEAHACVPPFMDFHASHFLSAAFRQAISNPKAEDVLLCTEEGTLPPDYLTGCTDRGLGFECTQLIACPLQRPSGGVIAWLVLGINPRRAFDAEYRRFTRLISRHMEGKLGLILMLEREKKVAARVAEEAAQQQKQLSLQLQQQKQELEQSHLRFFNFAKQALVGVYVVGSNGEMKFCNDAFCAIFDIVPGNVPPNLWLLRAHPDDLDKLHHEWTLFLEGRVQNHLEWRVLRPGATSFDSEDDIIYLESCGFPEMAEDGTMNSVTGLTTDVTIQKRYQREQAEKLDNALEAKRAQGYFMDMVSHEMRNPLNAMIQCAEEISQLIGKTKDSVRVHDETNTALCDIEDMIHTVLYCGAHQKQLIDDVLTLSKLDSKLLTIYPAKVYPMDLLRQAIRVFDSEIRASGVQVSTNLDESITVNEEGSAIMLDPSRIMQILINLISNAIKFMRGRLKCELHITVHVSPERQSIGTLRHFSSGHERADPTLGAEWGTGEPVFVYFSVRDTGPGLSSSEMSSLFNRFQQASPRTHVQYGGSGLGLFISRELTELHGGEIGMMSEVDQGSTFVFYVKGRRHIAQLDDLAMESSLGREPQHRKGMATIARKMMPSTPRLSVDLSSEPTSSAILHVLVVEDNDINRKVLKRQLERLGYQVTTAIHGEEALRILKTSTWWQGNATKDDKQFPDTKDVRPRFSIILCDLEMPVMDGITCVRQIRRWQQEGLLYANISVVAVTGNARAETTFLATESDFDHVVSKPYSFKSLVEQMLVHVNKSVSTTTEQ